MKKRTIILGIPFDVVTLPQAVDRLARALEHETFCHAVTAGPEFLMMAKTNESFRDVLTRAELVVPDGIGVVLAAHLLGKDSLHRVTGMDLLRKLFQLASREGWRIFLYGAMPGVAERVAARIAKEYRGASIVGVDSGFRRWFRIPDRVLCWKIRRSKADIVLVALGAPQQELWIDCHRHEFGNVRIAIGVGGAFDYLAGVVPYPLKVVRLLGMEWLWRLVRQPRLRWRRIIAAVVEFPLAVLRERFRHGES